MAPLAALSFPSTRYFCSFVGAWHSGHVLDERYSLVTMTVSCSHDSRACLNFEFAPLACFLMRLLTARYAP
ncbi:hypothetical protein BJV82DRAFT_595761 [Fennellomyces sp. T-0311]|nr:hypothetical protein BJV82DRAFT_595761 [Fennellomyces sp. T-0311]